jgi:hypothetical protein
MTSGTGNCSLTATWTADNNYSGATKSQTTTAQLATPTVTFTGAPGSEVYWGTFNVSATTNASTPALITVGHGSVCSIISGGVNTATVQMNSGTGNCSLTATWQADNNYTSATAMQSTTATKAASSTAFSTNPNPSTVGQKVKLSAMVSKPQGPNNGVNPTGTIQFEKSNGNHVGAAVGLNSSAMANLNHAFTAKANVKLMAVYSGDSNYAPSTSSVVTQMVNQ